MDDPAFDMVTALRQHRATQWWGKKSEERALTTYKAFSNLYLMDERYTHVDGEPNLPFTAFITKAMLYYADTFRKKVDD